MCPSSLSVYCVHVMYMCCTCVVHVLGHVLGHANDSRHGHSRFTCNWHFCYVQCDLRFLERERERERVSEVMG